MNVHILFGHSAAGSLKWLLKDIRQDDINRVIGFGDQFAVGPIRNLEADIGLEERVNWFKSHMPEDELDHYFEDEYEAEFRQTLKEIEEISENESITIWAANNAHEQTGLRFALKLLQDKTNEILIVNPSYRFEKEFKVPGITYIPLHTGEITLEKLKIIMENPKHNERLSITDNERLVVDWKELSSRSEVLRIWENNKIKSVESDFFDPFIIQTAKRLHGKRKKNTFMKSARLIGEVIGHLEQYIGDTYIQYRLIHLIDIGIFEYEGTLNSMRNYSVRLNGMQDQPLFNTKHAIEFREETNN